MMISTAMKVLNKQLKKPGDLGSMAKMLAVFAVLLYGVLPSGHAVADPCDEEQDENAKANYKTVVGPDGRKVFVIEKAFVVCGKVPKPEVIYVLQASTISYEWDNLKRDFLPKIRDSINRDPF